MRGFTTVRGDNLPSRLATTMGRALGVLRRMAEIRHPTALIGTELPPAGPGLTTQVHRYLAVGTYSGWPRIGWWTVQTVLVVRRGYSRRGDDRDRLWRDLQVRYAAVSGMSLAEQGRRLRLVVTTRGIPKLEAYQYGLLPARGSNHWDEYVYSCERDWNLAASVAIARAVGRRGDLTSEETARKVIALLSDKVATSDVLRSVGVPVAPTVELLPSWHWHDLDAAIDALISRWSEAFLKPRSGSGGEGAFIAGGRPGDRWVRGYQDGDRAPDAGADMKRRALQARYLAQPLLRSSRTFSGVCSDADVVTLRVVTRDWGHGPQVFSRVLELPVIGTENRLGYVFVSVAPDGKVLGPVWQPWLLPRRQSPAFDATIERVSRLTAPGVHAACEWAREAHVAVGPLFAVAWDIALTDEGPVFLEGNTGFDVVTPQTAFGGLLARVDATSLQ